MTERFAWKVFKFPLPVVDLQYLDLPEGAEILAVQMQGNVVCLWALCEPEQKTAPRLIRIMGTGHKLGIHEHCRFISTFQMESRALVFHVFEVQNGVI